jgi:hypothetical protein
MEVSNGIDWRAVVSEWQGSKVSQVEFCRREKLPYWKFRAELKKTGWESGQKRYSRSAEKRGFIEIPSQVMPKNLVAASTDDFVSISIGTKGIQLRVRLDIRI